MSIAELISSPLAQDPAYHVFADQRALFSIPHFWNVVSNLAFLIVGAWGLRITSRRAEDPLYAAWLTVFIGVFLTGLGSMWYHLEPVNESLFWDRLAMTIGFMGLVAAVLGEYISKRLAIRLLLPLLAVGTGSVVYWIHSESLGVGDLRAYALVQFVPLIVLPLIIIVRLQRSDLSKYFFVLFLAYAVAKAAEVYDLEVYRTTQLISGHTLKHLLAAFGLLALVIGLRRRQRG
ncbi:MAG: ceramidase domain-containing protein [Woeseiaceae bacterium]|nr:ceramidase domain-containing protein [Woeseiaceae bacterium]